MEKHRIVEVNPVHFAAAGDWMRRGFFVDSQWVEC